MPSSPDVSPGLKATGAGFVDSSSVVDVVQAPGETLTPGLSSIRDAIGRIRGGPGALRFVMPLVAYAVALAPFVKRKYAHHGISQQEVHRSGTETASA
jgi:hypothetical protein